MMKKLSVEEVRDYIEGYSSDCKEFVTCALEEGCEAYMNQGLVLIKRTDELKELRDDCVGLYMSISSYDPNEFGIWIAIDGSYGLHDWLNLGDYLFSESFSSIVSRAIKEAGYCNMCHQFVGYKDIHQYSFAGKCCSNCLSEAKKKYEYPGWYN